MELEWIRMLNLAKNLILPVFLQTLVITPLSYKSHLISLTFITISFTFIICQCHITLHDPIGFCVLLNTIHSFNSLTMPRIPRLPRAAVYGHSGYSPVSLLASGHSPVSLLATHQSASYPLTSLSPGHPLVSLLPTHQPLSWPLTSQPPTHSPAIS